MPLALTACGSPEDDSSTGDTGEAGTATPGQEGQEGSDGDEDDGDGTYAGLPEVGETLTVDGAEITPSNLREHERDPSSQICADVSITVPSDSDALNVRGLAA